MITHYGIRRFHKNATATTGHLGNFFGYGANISGLSQLASHYISPTTAELQTYPLCANKDGWLAYCSEHGTLSFSSNGTFQICALGVTYSTCSMHAAPGSVVPLTIELWGGGGGGGGGGNYGDSGGSGGGSGAHHTSILSVTVPTVQKTYNALIGGGGAFAPTGTVGDPGGATFLTDSSGTVLSTAAPGQGGLYGNSTGPAGGAGGSPGGFDGDNGHTVSGGCNGGPGGSGASGNEGIGNGGHGGHGGTRQGGGCGSGNNDLNNDASGGNGGGIRFTW